MSFAESLALVAIGAAIGHVGPRIPTLFMTRTRGFNTQFAPHPLPVELSPHLTQRVLHLRTFYWLSFVLAAVVLVFGAVSLRWGSAAFGFGLWLSSSWMVLSRLQQFLAGRPAPWTYAMAVELQQVMNHAQSETACCQYPIPVWGLQAVTCRSCSAVLSSMARPDLGRVRKDGRLRGTTRLLITDGFPFAEPLTEGKNEQE